MTSAEFDARMKAIADTYIEQAYGMAKWLLKETQAATAQAIADGVDHIEIATSVSKHMDRVDEARLLD